jgi:dihydroneopterin aldolase
VNVKAGIPFRQVAQLDQTIDYEIVLRIIQQEFLQAKPLLEELVYTIERKVVEMYPDMIYFYLSIKKMNPPLGCEVEHSEVCVERRYNK